MSVLLVYRLGLQMVLGALALAAPGEVPPCPPAWHEVPGLVTCIKLGDRTRNWTDARAVCQRDGGDLVKVENYVMSDFILNITIAWGKYYWTGLNDRSEEGKFRWLDENDQATYIMFEENRQGLDTPWNNEEENCVTMYCERKKKCGVNRVMPCRTWTSFICEKPQFVFADIPAPPVTSSCPDQWEENVYSGTCIHRFWNELDWQNARWMCQLAGGDLIKIRSQHTLDFIASIHHNTNPGDYWIGLNDVTTEGQVHWLDDETDEPDYLAWKEEPLNNSDASDCVHMEFDVNLSKRRVWSFGNCDQERDFICEKRPSLIIHVSAEQLGLEFLCHRGWIRSSRTGTCVKLFHDMRSWDEARESCKARGGDLVKVVDFHLNQLIINQIQTLVGTGQYSDSDNYWIGLRAYDQRDGFHWLDGQSTDDREIAHFGQKRRLKRKALIDPRSRWSNKTVPYKIDHGMWNPKKRKNITEAIKHWEKHTCIKFRDSKTFHYTGAAVMFKDEGKCQSKVGMSQTASYQIVEVGTCDSIGYILHEIGHVIGFTHEHKRPDRDRYVHVSDDLVQSEPQNYEKFSNKKYDTFNLPFDYSSIMLYPLKARDPAYQNIIGRAERLSFLDIKMANQMYKCAEDCHPRPPCPYEGFVAKDCKCYCQGKPGGQLLELCNIFNVTQPKFTPWSPDFSHEIVNTCAEINIGRVPTGSWRNTKCNAKNKYICQRPQLSTGQIAQSYLPLMKRVGTDLFCKGWTASRRSGTCVKLIDKLRTWSEARDECKADAGDLVKIVDKKMDDRLMGYAGRRVGSDYWIGLSHQRTTRSPHWLDEIGKPNYTNYDEAKPGCYAIIGRKWVARPCSRKMFFICERPTAYPSPERVKKQLDLTTDWEVTAERLERNISINCSAAIAGVPSDVKKIQKLQMTFHSQSMSEVTIAYVTPKLNNVICLLDRPCILDVYGRPTNLRKLQIHFKIPKPGCFDGGYYECISTYQDERIQHLYGNLTNTVVTTKRQFVTIKDPLKNLSLSVEPFKTDNIYKETDHMVLTCSVQADFRKVETQFEFEWRNGLAEGNTFYKAYKNVRNKPARSVAGGNQCSLTRTTTFTIKGKPRTQPSPVDIFQFFLPRGTGSNFVKVSHIPEQAVSHLHWCSAKYGNEVVHTTRINITTLEEADTTSILLAEIRSEDGTNHVEIRCNAAAAELPSEFTQIRGLQITRQTRSNPEGFERIMETFPYYPVGAKEGLYKPDGRKWSFHSNRAWRNPKHSRSFRIGLSIPDPVCGDNGIYQCTVTYVKDGFTLKHSKRQELKMSSDMRGESCGKETIQAPDAFISPSVTKRPVLPEIRNPSKLSPQDVFQIGRPLEILCNSTELGNASLMRRILQLRVSRQVEGSEKMSEIATNGIYLRLQRFTTAPVTGPNWNITFFRRPKELEIGGPQPGVIKWVIKKAQPEDAGIYQCGIFFYDDTTHGFTASRGKWKKMPHISKISASSQTQKEEFMIGLNATVLYFEGRQYLPARVGARNLHFALTPSDANNEHLENDIVSFSCSVEGAKNLKINLRPVAASISLEMVSSTHLSIPADEPGYWKHKSTLIVKLRAAGSHTVLCDAQHNQWTEFSKNLTVHVLTACASFTKLCLPSRQVFGYGGIHQRMFPTAPELHALCQHDRWRKSRCSEILRNMNCGFGAFRIQKSKIAKELYRFRCSTRGKMLLAEMSSSVCSRDRALFQDMVARLADSNGIVKSALRYQLRGNNVRYGTKTPKDAICEVVGSGRTEAVSQAKQMCGEAVAKYVHSVYRIKDSFWYKSCEDCRWRAQQCDNRILGFDLSGNRTYNWITQNTDNMIQMCSLWREFKSCYKGYEEFCEDEDYKLMVQTETLLMEIACSGWGKQIRISPCKRGMETYKELEESLRYCHSDVKLKGDKTYRLSCKKFEYRLKCFVKKTELNSGCGKSLALYIARKFVLNDRIQYTVSNCTAERHTRSSVENCPLFCENLVPGINATTVPQPFRLSWIPMIRNRLKEIHNRKEDKMRACWNILRAACPDPAAQEQVSNWIDLLQLVCVKRKKGQNEYCNPQMVRRVCLFGGAHGPTELKTIRNQRLEERVINCQQDLNSKLGPISSISHMGSDCKLIQESERCLLQLFQEEGSRFCRPLLAQIWTIFLRDDVAALRKRCYANCPEGWSLAPSANNCVRVFNEKKTWFEARQACGENSDLVKIEDPFTSSFIAGLIKVLPTNPIVFWIGLNDRKVEGEYRWLDETSEYTDSGVGNLGESSSEDCVTMSGSLWLVSECTVKHSYICQQPSFLRCWEADDCVRKFVGRYIGSSEDRVNLMELLNFTESTQLSTICMNLTACFAQHEPLCKYTESQRHVKGFMDNFCSIVGWDLIAKAKHSTCFVASISFDMTQQTDRYKNSLRKFGMGGKSPPACSEIMKSLYEILQETRDQCDIYLASFESQVVRYKVNYGDNKCVDLDNGCWQLRSCLLEFTETPPAIAEFDWVLMFQKIEQGPNPLNKLCPRITVISECYKDHGQYCRNKTFVDNVKTAITLLNHLCRIESKTDGNHRIRKYMKNFTKTMSYLREKCVVGLHESLNSSDLLDLEEHYLDASPHLSDDLCRRIEETERDCVLDVARQLGDKYNIGHNYHFWLDIWLVVMGDKLSGARDTCHGVSSCPVWSMRKPNGSTCLVLRGKDTYEKATAECGRLGGDLVDITDINMMSAVADFITRKLSVLKLRDAQYDFWIKDLSPWTDELFDSTGGKMCPLISKSAFEHFWYPVDGNCTGGRAYFVCEEPTRCKVKSTCRTGWTLSPDGEACLRVADSPGLRGGSYDVCTQDGSYITQFKNKQMRRIIYDLLPLNASKSFWVMPIRSVPMDDFTKNKAYKDLHRFSTPTTCAQMNIKLPMKLKTEDCAQSAAALCWMEPVRCQAGQGGLTKRINTYSQTYEWSPSTKVTLDKAECEAGSFTIEVDEILCVRIHYEQVSWYEARTRCRDDGQDLLDFGRNFSVKSIVELLDHDAATNYWTREEQPVRSNQTFAACKLIYRVQWGSEKRWFKRLTQDTKYCHERYGFICENAVSKSAPDKCPNSMASYKEVCLDPVTTRPKTWTAAREDCRRSGGDLVKLASTDERKKYFIEGLANELNSGFLWLGLRQNNTVELGTFGEISYGFHVKSESLCFGVQPSVDNGKAWRLEKCVYTHQYICEYHAFGARSEALVFTVEHCQPGWLHMARSACIRLYSEMLTWSDARARCQEKGGDLVDYVTSNKIWKFLSERVAFVGAYWVGINDSRIQTTGKAECRSITQQSPNQLIMETARGKSCSKRRDGYICERRHYYSVPDL